MATAPSGSAGEACLGMWAEVAALRSLVERGQTRVAAESLCHRGVAGPGGAGGMPVAREGCERGGEAPSPLT